MIFIIFASHSPGIATQGPKQRILEVYLNIAEFGPGIYGVEAASQAFFGKPAAKLTAAEAARLAAVLPSPKRWSAKAPGPYVQKRVRWIMGQMGYGARTAEPEPPPPTPEELVEDFGRDEPATGLPSEPPAAGAESGPPPAEGSAPQAVGDPAADVGSAPAEPVPAAEAPAAAPEPPPADATPVN